MRILGIPHDLGNLQKIPQLFASLKCQLCPVCRFTCRCRPPSRNLVGWFMVGYDLFMALGELSTIYIGYGWTINHSNYDSNVDYDGLLSAINFCDLWLWWLVMVMMVIYSYESHKKNYLLEKLYYQLLWSTWLMSRQCPSTTSRRESQNRRPLSQCPVDPSGQSLAYSMGDSMTARAEEPLMPANTSRDIRGHQRLAMEKP